MNLTSLIARIAIRALWPKAWVFECSARDPVKAQEGVLLEYVNRNKDTEYGRKYNFSKIRSIKDYQALVPMSDSDTIKPYIERMKRGEEGVLVADEVTFFGLTSGTTARQKFIPVTEYSRKKKADVAALWSYYIERDHPGVIDGKILAIISPDEEGRTEKGVRYGAESGHGYKNLPRFIQNLYSVPYEVFEITDYDARYYSILRISMEQDITTVATLNPSTLVLLCQRIEKCGDMILKDIESGGLDKSLDIPPDIRRTLETRLKANPVRAMELRRILAERGALLPKDFWPNLKLIECWKGGTVSLYLKELPQYFGDIPVRDFGCLSTEARSSIPMSDEGAGGVLAVNTNFYEFVPVDDIGRRAKRFLLCNELKMGSEYYLIVTTPGGLYRYNIDDIVKVDGFFRRTPMIEFVQKGSNAVSLMGEKLYESQVTGAVNRAVDRTKVLLEFFSVYAQVSRPAHYIFMVEFDGTPDESGKKSLLKAIEEELYAENQEYEFARKSQLLAPPVLKVVRKGGFERYREMKVAQGAHDSQFKVPELTQDPSFPSNFEFEEEIALA